MLTQLPEGTERTMPGYDGSGWPTYERRSAEQIKKFYLCEAKWKLVLDLGVGTRGTRIGATPMHFRARARRRGGGRLTSRSSSSWSSLPRTREMSLLLAFGTRRSERRSASIVDAALVEECVETWEGGARSGAGG